MKIEPIIIIIEEAGKVKLLGVYIDKGYAFSSHTTQVAATVKQKVEKTSTVLKFLN